MNFPLPDRTDEDRGLLNKVRLDRKYEKKKTTWSTSKTKLNKKKDGDNPCCMVTMTTIGGILIIIGTIFLTIKEIMSNKNIQITAVPMNYNNEQQDEDNDILDFLEKDNDYMYPRISLEEVRAEIEKSKSQESEQQNKLVKISNAIQTGLLPTDWPDGANTNTVTDFISEFFKDTEFYRRYRMEGDIEWSAMLSNSKAAYNESLYDTLPICIQHSNQKNGYGYRIWRDTQVSYQSTLMGCSMAVHWGWLSGICPKPNGGGASDVYNVFEFLWYNNDGFAASHESYNNFQNTIRFPPLHNYNVRFATLAHTMYDFNGPFINGSMEITHNANKNIQPDANNKWDIPKTVQKYNKELSAETIDPYDKDIDKVYSEILAYDGGTYLTPILRYYGLMVQHLRYKHRKIIVDYIENNWKNNFVIAFHIQTNNKGNMDPFATQIVSALTHLLKNNLDFWIPDDKNIIIYISTDCGEGEILNNFISQLKTDISTSITNEGLSKFGSVNVLIREQMRLKENTGHIFESSITGPTMDQCINLLGNLQIDSELLGLSDFLILPSKKRNYRSTYTRLSRALMMKRHKIICKATQPNQYVCKNFDTKADNTFSV